MIGGVRTDAISAELMGHGRFDEGIAALHRTSELDGSLSRTFFKKAG